MTPPHTFIKAAEVWIPSEDKSLLEFGAGAFGPARGFGALSRSMCFGRGEGLPGQTWEEGRAILLSDFESAHFRRTAAARAAGLTCAVSIPFFTGGSLKAVLVIFCGHIPTEGGALELWHVDPQVSTAMTLAGGAYGESGEAFESISRQTSFARGVGLPGLAWDQGTAQFLADLNSPSGSFVRGEAASDAGLIRGLSFPAGDLNGETLVVTFLATSKLPIAHRIERWAADDSNTVLRRVFAFSELHGGHSLTEASLPIPQNDTAVAGAIATAWTNRAAAINEHPASEPGHPAAAAVSIGANALLAIPLVRNGCVLEVLALYI
jgi:hypothetical protein